MSANIDPYEGIERVRILAGSGYTDPVMHLQYIIHVAKLFLPPEPDQPKSGECPCLLGFPHFCKDGEALLTSTRGLCPCECHKPAPEPSERRELECKRCGYWSPLWADCIQHLFRCAKELKQRQDIHRFQTNQYACLPECKGSDCPLGINCPCKCHDWKPSYWSKGDSELKDDLRDIQLGMAIAEIKKTCYTRAEIDERMQELLDLLCCEFIAANVKPEKSKALCDAIKDLQSRFLPK